MAADSRSITGGREFVRSGITDFVQIWRVVPYEPGSLFARLDIAGAHRWKGAVQCGMADLSRQVDFRSGHSAWGQSKGEVSFRWRWASCRQAKAVALECGRQSGSSCVVGAVPSGSLLANDMGDEANAPAMRLVKRQFRASSKSRMLRSGCPWSGHRRCWRVAAGE